MKKVLAASKKASMSDALLALKKLYEVTEDLPLATLSEFEDVTGLQLEDIMDSYRSLSLHINPVE